MSSTFWKSKKINNIDIKEKKKIKTNASIIKNLERNKVLKKVLKFLMEKEKSMIIDGD